MEKKTNTTLYFTKGAVPTEADYAAAKKLSGKVVFRNAAFANPDLAIEKCHAVAGAVPECYAKAYPVIDTEEPVEQTGTEEKQPETLQVQPVGTEGLVATPQAPASTPAVQEPTVNGGDGWPQQ